MVDDKNNLNKGESWYRPVMVFYAKTTSWVILPLVIAVLLSKFTSFGQNWFFILVMLGFGVTCSGIYREIKDYKKQLEQSDKEKDGNK
mgnify:CR=1 FL=1